MKSIMKKIKITIEEQIRLQLEKILDEKQINNVMTKSSLKTKLPEDKKEISQPYEIEQLSIFLHKDNKDVQSDVNLSEREMHKHEIEIKTLKNKKRELQFNESIEMILDEFSSKMSKQSKSLKKS